MKFLRQTTWETAACLGCWLLIALGSYPAHAQGLFDGKLPRIFNRGNDSDRPAPITRDSPIDFMRDFGVPTPQSLSLSTLKGHEVTFYLLAKTKTPGMTVDYIIRDFPSAGKIISLVSNPENRSMAKVVYYADPDSAATMDSFTFVARYPGGKLSQAARCDIKIEEARPEIDITPQTLDFGRLMIGSHSEKEFTITNQGNALYQTKLSLIEPFKLISPANGQVFVPPGKRVKVKIGYSPTVPSPSSYQILLSREKNGKCVLNAESYAPFSITKESWELKFNPKTERREAEIHVMNYHDRPLQALVRSSARLKVKSEQYAILLPEQETKIGVYLEKDDLMAFEGGFQLVLKEGYHQKTSVFANTLPARMHIEVPNQIGQEVINFGKVIGGRSSERGIMIKNMGGELLGVEILVNEPFRVLSKTTRQLVPLEVMPVSIGFFPHASDHGKVDQFLTIRGTTSDHQIRLVANAVRNPKIARPRTVVPVAAKSAVKPPPSSPDAPPQTAPATDAPTENTSEIGNQTPPSVVASPDRLKASVSPAPPLKDEKYWISQLKRKDFIDSLSPLGIITRDLIDRERAPGLKSAQDIELIEATSDSLEFGWTAPKDSELDTFEVEMRGTRIDPVTSAGESVWAPYPDVKYERIDRLVKAKIDNLNPNTLYEFRIFTVDVNGRSSPPSIAFVTQTTRTMDWTYIYLGLGILFLGLFVWALVKVIRDRYYSGYSE